MEGVLAQFLQERGSRNLVKGVKGLDSRYPDVCKANIKLGNFPVDRVRIDKIEI